MDFFGVARCTPSEFADAVTALISHPARGIATKACRSLEPFAPEQCPDLIHGRLRHREGEPVESDGKNMIVHAESSLT